MPPVVILRFNFVLPGCDPTALSAMYAAAMDMAAYGEGRGVTLLADDPDKAWADLGHHLLYEARRYRRWKTDDMHSAVLSLANSVDELRAEGVYQILSPDEAIVRCYEQQLTTLVLHPMCGGISPERAWETVNLCLDRVLPALA